MPTARERNQARLAEIRKKAREKQAALRAGSAVASQPIQTNQPAQVNTVKKEVIPAPSEPSRTVEQRAESLFQREQFDRPQETATKLGLNKNDISSTLEEEVTRILDAQKRELGLAENQVSVADQLDEETVRKAKLASAGAKAGVTANLSGGREGPQSAGNPLVRDKFIQETQRNLDSLIQQKTLAREERQNALTNLKEAQRQGREDLVKQYQAQVDNLKLDIAEIDTNLLNAQEKQTRLALDIQDAARVNLETFTDIVGNGTTMTVDGIKSFANKLDIPFEIAFDYYNGAEQIRADKTLSLEEKQVALAENQIDFERKKAGRDDEKVRRLDYIDSLYQSGAPQQEIDRAMDAFGFTTNRVMEAETRLKEAEARLKEAEANGEIISPKEQLEYASMYQEYREQIGDTGAYLPTESKYKVAATEDGIQVQVKEGQKLKRGQCGAFANDVLGISVGDTLASKMKFVDESVVVPSPGMGFVTTRGYDLGPGKGNSGHIGVVESVNPDGTFNTVESNYNGDQKISRRKNVPISEVAGFIRPQKAEFTGKATGEELAFRDAAGALEVNLGDKVGQKFRSDLERRINSGNIDSAKEFLKVTIRSSAPAETQKQIGGAELGIKLIGDIKSDLEAFEAAGGDTGILAGTSEQVANKIGKTTDPVLAKLATKIQATIQNYRKAISGAAFTESESKEYERIFPNTKKTTNLNAANISALEDVFDVQLETFYSNALGESAYKQLFTETETQDAEIDPLGLGVKPPEDPLKLF